MSAYHVIAIPETLAQEVRETLKAPGYGHPAHVERRPAMAPAASASRSSPRRRGGPDPLHLRPVQGLDSYPSPGPVFIHREACPHYDQKAFPPEASATCP